MNTQTVGVIGLGQMGKPMAANLVKRGFRTLGCDVSAASLAAAAELGVIPAASAREVFAAADVTVLSLPTQEILEQVVLGAGGLIEVAQAPKIIVDTTTTTVALAQRLHAALAVKGVAFLDSPVTGGVAGAEQAALSIMIGGEAEAVARARPVFDALGNNIVHIGPSGHGQVAKMVNQMLMAAIYTSVAEGFAFAAQFGADVEKVFQAVEQGGAKSKQLSTIGPSLIAGTVRTNGNLAQHGKDIGYVIAEANHRKFFLPITSAVHEFYQLSRTLGFGRNSSHDMWAVWEKLLGIDLRATMARDRTP